MEGLEVFSAAEVALVALSGPAGVVPAGVAPAALSVPEGPPVAPSAGPEGEPPGLWGLLEVLKPVAGAWMEEAGGRRT